MPAFVRFGMTDPAIAGSLGDSLNRCFETFDAPADAIAEDVFCDLFPPFWRFQLQGREDLSRQLRAVAGGAEVTSKVLRVVPTASGFVFEHEETHRGDSVVTARHLSLCEVRRGLITEFVTYCNGGWDDELRARHAAEAPMLRP